jgi:hypothetical protein
LASACGGTTGQEDIPTQSMAPDAGSVDATIAEGASSSAPGDATIDYNIMYADANRLPNLDAIAPQDAAEAAALPYLSWPVCAQDQNATNPNAAVPWVIDDSGACGSQVWTRSADCDLCIREQDCDDPTQDLVFPPCNFLWEAGAATSGPGATVPLVQLCGALWDCLFVPSPPPPVIEQGTGLAEFFCGDAGCMPNANGRCALQMEAVYQNTNVGYIESHFTSSLVTDWPGGSVNKVAQCALTTCIPQCFAVDAGSP